MSVNIKHVQKLASGSPTFARKGKAVIIKAPMKKVVTIRSVQLRYFDNLKITQTYIKIAGNWRVNRNTEAGQ